MKTLTHRIKLDGVTKGWLICSLGAIFFCYEYLLRIEPSIMVPELMTHFNLSPDKFGALISLYYLAYTPMQLIVGVIMDMYKPRYVLSAAVLMCAAGSFLFSISNHLMSASIGRLLMGVGSAFAFVGALKLATIWLPENRFASFSGMVTGLGMLGGFLGNVVLTKLSSSLGWQGTLYLVTAAGCALLPIMWYQMKEKKVQEEKLVTQTNYHQLFSQLFKVFKNKEIWKMGLVGSLLFLSLSVFAELWGITFLKEVYHLSSNQAALANSMIFLGWLIGAPLNGYISDRFNNKEIHLSIGCLLSTVTISMIVFIPYMSLPTLQIFLFIFGLASSTQLLCFVIGREASPKNISASTLSFINVLVMLGGLLIQPLVGFLLLHTAPYFTTTHSYQLVFSILPLAFFAAMIITHFLKKTDHTLFHTKDSFLPPFLMVNED